MMLLLACAQTLPTDRVEPTFIYVTVLQDEVGSVEEPLAFSSETAALPVKVETLDVNGDPYPMNGDLVIKLRPGRLDQEEWVTVSDGLFEGEIQFGNGFASTRVWFSDEGDKNASSGRVPSFATGVSDPPLWYALPTLGEINRIDDVDSNQLENEFTEVRAIDRDVRVTAVGTNGYWITDMADEVGEHNNLFVYTFSRPRDEVVVGARLTLLTGANQEYLGTTQLSFPTYEVSDDEVVEVPEPATLSISDCADLQVFEGHESSVVRFEDVQIPDSFTSGDDDYEDWAEYGQWPVGDCLYVDNSVTIPDFVPTAGADIPYVQGMLNQVFDKWIVLPRDADDLAPTAGGPPSPPPRMPAAPGEPPHSHAPSEPCLP